MWYCKIIKHGITNDSIRTLGVANANARDWKSDRIYTTEIRG